MDYKKITHIEVDGNKHKVPPNSVEYTLEGIQSELYIDTFLPHIYEGRIHIGDKICIYDERYGNDMYDDVVDEGEVISMDIIEDTMCIAIDSDIFDSRT